jgi:REP element-mobilizing transposase RayT
VSIPLIQHRKTIRLQGYDYSQAGGYYVTIATQGRECLFGEIRNDEMILNSAGNMVVKWWNELANKFPSVTPDMFVVMPNHFHGIIFIHEIVGADLRVGRSEMGERTGSPLRNDGMGVPLSQVVQWFKTMTTNEYVRGVKQSHWPPFPGKLWQRNYYEHIICNQTDYERIANYILTNPANWAKDEENR